MTYHEQRFGEFLQLFIYYLCSRCEMGAPHHGPQDLTNNNGGHQHNGEILQLLADVPPAAHRLFAAFDVYLKQDPPAYIYAQIAHAYNNSNLSRPRKYDVLERTVECLLANTRRTWIKHGCERPDEIQYDKNAAFPPLHTRSHVGSMGVTKRDENAFAVDLDSWPFDTCSTHSIDSTAPWGYISGYIPITKFNGKFLQPDDRDHYYAQGNNPTHAWLFVYKEMPAHEQELHNNLHQIRNQNLMHIHQDTLQKLYTLTKKLQHVYDVKKRS